MASLPIQKGFNLAQFFSDFFSGIFITGGRLYTREVVVLPFIFVFHLIRRERIVVLI
jgi:hypothetical protein